MSNKKKAGPKKAKNRIRKGLLQFFKQHPSKPFNFKQLRSHLNVQGENEVMHMENAIAQLLEDKTLVMEGKGSVRFNPDGAPAEEPKRPGMTVKGRVDLTRNGAAYIIVPDLDQDVYVSSKKVMNALDGDVVEVKVLDLRKGKRPEGEIVKIVERARETFVCTLQLSDKFAFGVPDNRKMDVDFFIPLRFIGGAKQGQKVLVKLKEFKPNQKNPVGEVIAVLGEPGHHETEMNAIMLEHDLPLSFPPKVLEAAEGISEDITAKEIGKRRDFREVLTFTIDPWDAKDFDDALSFQKLEDGLYEIGIHIADVSHYVKPDCTIDKEAQKRATSVYLVDRVIPMLPERLSNQLCSLRPNEDKLCFSAVFHINENGTVKDRWFGRTVIHSQRRFTYEEAQERIESAEGDLADELQLLDRIAKKLRGKRFKAGAISFEREEMRFRLDEEGHPLEIVMKVSKDAHKLIEEYMLLANREVAENARKLVQARKKPPFVFRVHDKPSEEKLLSLQTMAARFGFEIDLHDPAQASKEINKLLEMSHDSPAYNLLSILSIRSMAKARYTTKNMGHYGLAFKHYTHFTSPIRRYPDVMVHRLLAQYLDGNVEVNAEHLEQHCEHSSAKEVEAEGAERDSTKYKQVEYMQQFVGDEFTGHISGLNDNMMFVELENRCEGALRLSNMVDDSYYFDEERFQIVGHNKRKTFKLGDTVQVRVIACDLEKRNIDLDLIGKGKQQKR